MLKKIVSVSALALALAACESTDCDSMRDGMYDGSMSGSFADACGHRVHFATNSHHLTAEGKATLHKQAEWAKANPCGMQVAGNCDERGTSQYNLALGERRSAEAKKELVRNGVPADSISTVSYGKERSTQGASEAVWAQDRNATTTVE